MMNDEKTEGKKQEEQAPPKPWLFRQLEKIKHTTDTEDINNEFRVLFKGMTSDNTSYKDSESIEYKEKMLRYGKDAKEIFTRLNNDFAMEFLRQSNSEVIKALWSAWTTERMHKELKDITWVDFIALYWISLLKKQQIVGLCNDFPDFYGLTNLAEQYYFNYEGPQLELIGTILEKLGDENEILSRKGRNYRARTQALESQKQLELATVEKMKEFDDSIKNVQARFIQIIGIFAAIIAFIVTMVPTAARLGGASIPVALAGLAIVTAGIIVLLAMIFGKDDKPRRGLKRGLVVAVVFFVGWFVTTILLASVKPELLRPPPDPVRVDTVYKYESRVDTVQTIIIKPEQ